MGCPSYASGVADFHLCGNVNYWHDERNTVTDGDSAGADNSSRLLLCPPLIYSIPAQYHSRHSANPGAQPQDLSASLYRCQIEHGNAG